MIRIMLMSLVVCSGCSTVATSVVTQAGVQTIGEQYLISQNKPMIKCNIVNVLKSNKMCRVSRTYIRKKS